MIHALCRALEQQLDLDYPDERGWTLRQHLERALAGSGPRDPRLNGPDVPWAGEHIYAWFWELRQAAAPAGAMEGPLSHTEISAWRGLLGIRLDSWEVWALRAMDNQYLSFAAGRRRGRKGG